MISIITIIIFSFFICSTFIYFLNQAKLFILSCPFNILHYLSIRRKGKENLKEKKQSKKGNSIMTAANSNSIPSPFLPLPPASSLEPTASALVIIAHPDDECMFFGPVIRTLIKQGGFRVHLLCLSSGSATSPSIRRKELQTSCQRLGISKVRIIDDQVNLKDGLKENWSIDVITSYISSFVDTELMPMEDGKDGNDDKKNRKVGEKVDLLITFDGNGISGHPNHIAVHKATRVFAISSKREFKLWELESIPLITKYSGLASVILDATFVMFDLMLNGIDNEREIRLICTIDSNETERIKKAMKEHRSQMVWYRKLYILFSRYLYTNTLKFKKPIISY